MENIYTMELENAQNEAIEIAEDFITVNCTMFSDFEEFAETAYWKDLDVIHSGYDGELYLYSIADGKLYGCTTWGSEYALKSIWKVLENDSEVVFAKCEDAETIEKVLEEAGYGAEEICIG